MIVAWIAGTVLGAVSLLMEPHSVYRQVAFWGPLICLNVWAATSMND
jgi:hypothetical protein